MRSNSRLQLSLIATIFALLALPSAAAGWRGAIDDVVRSAGRLSDDIPLNSTDELLQSLKSSPAVKKAADDELAKAGLLNKALDASGATARSDAIAALLRQISGQLDSTTLATLKTGDEAVQEYALVLAKGAERVSESIPDLLQRSRFVADGGIETVTAIGLHGPEAAKSALRLDAAIKSGGMVVPSGLRQITLKDFGRVMSDATGASWKFWTTYVVPHWKLWAGSGLAAAYLVDPEGFQDKAGELSEKGMEAIVSFAGEVGAATIRGIGKGSDEAAEELKDAVKETYSSGWKGIYSVGGTILVLLIAGLFLRRTRFYLLLPLRWLNKSPRRE